MNDSKSHYAIGNFQDREILQTDLKNIVNWYQKKGGSKYSLVWPNMNHYKVTLLLTCIKIVASFLQKTWSSAEQAIAGPGPWLVKRTTRGIRERWKTEKYSNFLYFKQAGLWL